jgi:hypothetical protein
MDSDLINISLNQGKQFKNYQKKIKKGIESVEKSRRTYNKKEGFEMPSQMQSQIQMQMPMNYDGNSDNLIQKRDDRAASISKVNKAEQQQLTNLQNKYNDLQTQYNDTQKQLNDNSLVSIKRTSPNNPYLNKNIKLTENTTAITNRGFGDFGGYVTEQGLYKPYRPITYRTSAGKNGCPANQPDGVGINDFSSSLLQGEPMGIGQSCGNEGKNVYVSQLASNPKSSYVGCYNDKPAPTMINAIPIMNSSNSVNGFQSGASSVYQNNNDVGPWAAFDQNPSTFWHAGVASNNLYNAPTGEYKGTNQVVYTSFNSGMLTAKGEFLQINMPGVNSDSVQNIKVTQYSITPRGDNNLFLQRSPNTWHIFGYKFDTDGVARWYEIDYQTGQSFTSVSPKTYNIAAPDYFGAYIILATKVGNDDQTTIRDCLQIADFNLFVNSDATFTNSDRAMIYNSSAIGYTSFDECKKYAIDNDYKYFGLQDFQPDGTAACLVSNDYQRTINYGDASSQMTISPIWSSNTQSGGQPYLMQVVGAGQLIVYDVNNNNAGVFISNEAVADCVNWGTITINSATYGGNCKVPIGNVTDKVASDLGCNWKDSCSIPISNATFGDPAQGCAKSFDIAYKCGGTSFSRNLTPAEGQTMILACNEYMQTTCQFFLILQDDGNMVLYKGNDPSTQKESIWSSKTNGMQKNANPDWVASKGKYGRNYLTTGETLAVDEWVGSNDGSIKLIMQTDGNLVLYTSETKSGCTVKDDITYGGGWVNAVYKIEPTGNKASLGKVAYIDSDAKLKEYPSSLLSYSNQYQLLKNFDSGGNDIQQLNPTSNNEQGCIDACNLNGECAGFVYQPNGNICYLKNSAMYPSGEKQYYASSGITMGVRKPQIGSAVNRVCSKTIVDIDSIQYDHYVKGDPMTSETKCGTSIVLGEDKNILTNLQNSMLSTGQQIADQTDNLYTKNNNIYNTMQENSVQFNKNVDMYKANDNKIKSELNLPGRFQTETETKSKSNVNKREGMQNNVSQGQNNIRTIDSSSNSDKILTMNDINSMLSDTDIRVLQENYSYIFWSIVAVGLLTITVNQIKK